MRLPLLMTAAAASVLVALSIPVEAKSPAPKPACLTLAVTQAMAEKTAQDRGGTSAVLDAPVAQKFLDAINAIGKPTDLKADHVGLIGFPGKDAVMVLVADNPCGGYGHMVVLPATAALQAYGAARRGKPAPRSTM